MQYDRREFLHLVGGSLLAGGLPASAIATANVAQRRFKAIVFDAFPIFDPRPIAKLAEQSFPGKGTELINAWRTRQFEYQWLRALSGHYADFWQTTEEALVFAAELLHLQLTSEKRKRLMHAHLELKAWPDVPAALASLRQSGVRLGFLSNMTEKMLRAGIANAGLDGLFERVLSTDYIASYKPDPRAYRMALEAFELQRDQILFVAFAGWDVAGARWFGYPTFWVNRLNVPAEGLDTRADATGRDLADLETFVRGAE